MVDTFLLLGLPYLALGVLVVGTVYRFRTRPYGVSSLSSQVLESRILPLGVIPWHAAVAVLLLGHLIPFLLPGVWHNLAANRIFLLTVETIGLGAGVLAAVGLLILLLRRALHPRLRKVTRLTDYLVLGLLLGQVVLGLAVAVHFRWGSMWASGTLWPYLWGILTFRPDASLVAEMPVLIKAHLVGAWLIALLTPFSRLVHAFAVPFEYLTRSPQKVLWATRQRIGDKP